MTIPDSYKDMEVALHYDLVSVTSAVDGEAYEIVKTKISFTKTHLYIGGSTNEAITEAEIPANTEVLTYFRDGRVYDEGISYFGGCTLDGISLTPGSRYSMVLQAGGPNCYVWPFDTSLGGKFVFRIWRPREETQAGNGCSWYVWKVKSRVTGLEYNIE